MLLYTKYTQIDLKGSLLVDGLSGPKSTWLWDGGLFFKYNSTFILFLVVEKYLLDTSGVSTDC